MTQDTEYLDWTGRPIATLPQRITPGASAFVLNEKGELLLQKRSDNGYWCMPGGRMDPGESIAQTCVREVWEETGMRVRVKRLIRSMRCRSRFCSRTSCASRTP